MKKKFLVKSKSSVFKKVLVVFAILLILFLLIKLARYGHHVNIDYQQELQYRATVKELSSGPVMADTVLGAKRYDRMVSIESESLGKRQRAGVTNYYEMPENVDYDEFKDDFVELIKQNDWKKVNVGVRKDYYYVSADKNDRNLNSSIPRTKKENLYIEISKD